MANQKPIVLLLDISLPQLSRIEDVSEIQRLSPSTKIIPLTSTTNDKEAIRALMGGAKGYTSSDIGPSLLMKAIGVVQKGEIWAGAEIRPSCSGRTYLSHTAPSENIFGTTPGKSERSDPPRISDCAIDW